ncbi:hypothetical protein [Brevundimonas sp.]|uniref:hypothetical protein n=1 Tax=Brevundimonas sp. TaxID=1871086 RepID=UPI002619E183|nr:hypothetical protein [Brevundimonas sp.]
MTMIFRMQMLNPAAPLDDEVAARAAAGAASVALVISGVMSALGAALMVPRLGALRAVAMEEARLLADQSPQAGAMLQGMVQNGLAEWSVAIVALWAVIQFILASWQWRRPNQLIPLIMVVLLVYRLGDRGLEVIADPSRLTPTAGATLGLLLVCLWLHVVAVRGAARLAALRHSA